MHAESGKWPKTAFFAKRTFDSQPKPCLRFSYHGSTDLIGSAKGASHYRLGF